MKKFSIEIKWGIIFAVSQLLWTVLEKSSGLHDAYIDQHPKYTNLFAIIAIAVFVMALRDKRDNYYHGAMNWTQGFLSGVIISVVVTALSPLTQYISFTYITPDYFKNIIEYSVANNVLSREKSEAYFNLDNYMLMSVLSGISMGVVTSAVVALSVKSKSEKK